MSHSVRKEIREIGVSWEVGDNRNKDINNQTYD